MLVYGRVSKVNTEDYTVKLKLDDYDGFETPWLDIPLLYTRGNKSGHIPEIQTLCAAYLTEDMTDGFLIGAKYNDEDKIIVEYKGQDFIRYSDGVTLSHTPGTGQIYVKADSAVFDCNIICTKDIQDKNGTMQSIRDWANTHAHSNGNNGANTGTPTTQI